MEQENSTTVYGAYNNLRQGGELIYLGNTFRTNNRRGIREGIQRLGDSRSSVVFNSDRDQQDALTEHLVQTQLESLSPTQVLAYYGIEYTSYEGIVVLALIRSVEDYRWLTENFIMHTKLVVKVRLNRISSSIVSDPVWIRIIREKRLEVYCRYLSKKNAGLSMN